MATVQFGQQSSSSTVDPLAKTKAMTPLQRTLSRFIRHKMAMAGSIVLIVLALLGVFAPVVAPKDPLRNDIRNSFAAPSAEHWLGTDQNGRDVWSRTIYSIRISLSVGLVAASISTSIALVLGVLSGYYGGLVDMVIMRFAEVMMSIPSLLAIMSVVVLVGPSIFNIMVIIGLLGWEGKARLVRGQVLSSREDDYVMAARSMGASSARIMFVHILPNVIAPLIVAATFSVAGAILAEAGLSFLGFGTMPPTPSWGNMINQARSFHIMEQYPWLWVAPGSMILITVLSINFLGDGLRDALDPRMDIN